MKTEKPTHREEQYLRALKAVLCIAEMAGKGDWKEDPHKLDFQQIDNLARGAINRTHYFADIAPVRTHREDGTPLDIDPLPEIEGCKGVYVSGSYEDRAKQGEPFTIMIWSKVSKRWAGMSNKTTLIEESDHFAYYYKIQQPTTLKDLYPTGSENVWLHFNTGKFLKVYSVDDTLDDLEIQDASIRHHAQQEHRWSHSPHTSYEDAQPFVVEGGGGV